MSLISEIEGKSFGKDKLGTSVLNWEWNWHDDHIMRWIRNFQRITQENTYADVERQKIKRSGDLKRSLYWMTFAASGGDEQVFRARYIYYAKFVEIAVGWNNRYNGPVPPIPGKKWAPIKVPTRKMKGRPHVITEMRSQAKKFRSYAANHFSFIGTVYMVYAMGGNEEPSIRAAVNRALFFESTRGRFDR